MLYSIRLMRVIATFLRDDHYRLKIARDVSTFNTGGKIDKVRFDITQVVSILTIAVFLRGVSIQIKLVIRVGGHGRDK